MNFKGERQPDPDIRKSREIETVADYMSVDLVTFTPDQDINEATVSKAEKLKRWPTICLLTW